MMCECVTLRSAVPTSQGYLLYRQMRGPDHERLMPLMSIVANSISFHGINHNWLGGWNGQQDDCRCCRVSSCPHFLHALIGRRRRGEDWENRWTHAQRPCQMIDHAPRKRSKGRRGICECDSSFVCLFFRTDPSLFLGTLRAVLRQTSDQRTRLRTGWRFCGRGRHE